VEHFSKTLGKIEDSKAHPNDYESAPRTRIRDCGTNG
jgi:hypothetical protein